MKKSPFLILAVVGILALSCNLPGRNTPAQAEVKTAAALTVQAALGGTSPVNSATVVAGIPTKTSTLTTPSPTPTLTPTITPTYSVPMLTIKENTNCRTGPGQEYEIVFTFFPGASVEILGQYPQDNYWVVKLPDSNDTCWAWGQYATVSGSYWVVPTLQPPPTKTPAPPEAPTGLSYNYECTFNGVNTDITVNLKWSDRSDGEEGYRVLRDKVAIAELPPNSTTYSEIYTTDATKKVSYAIEVFLGKMTAQSKTISFSCQ